MSIDRTMETIALEPVDALTVTMLVDNVTDSLLADQGPAKRPSMGASPRIATRFAVGGDTDDALRAEHGFSALVTVEKAGRRTRLLFDAGRTPDGLVENMRRLDLSPGDIEIIVLSHGHWDHVTGMDGLVRRLGAVSMPVLIHPEFWTRRRLAFPGRDPTELPTTSKAALEGAGFEIIEQRRPSFPARRSALGHWRGRSHHGVRAGLPGHQRHRHGEWEPDPLILDDQALVANVRGHGLVVLTGCGHSGVINILRYVRTLTGEDRLHALLGGFHLSGKAFEPIIGPTCDALEEFSPDFLVPAHCSGWRATHALATRFPNAFIQTSVGTRFEFTAAEAQGAISPAQRRLTAPWTGSAAPYPRGASRSRTASRR